MMRVSAASNSHPGGKAVALFPPAGQGDGMRRFGKIKLAIQSCFFRYRPKNRQKIINFSVFA